MEPISAQKSQGGRQTGSIWLALFILAAFGLLTLSMTWPLITKFTTHTAGGRSDLLVHQWTFWWVKQALINGQSPFYTTLLFYPHGVSLTTHNIAWFNIALWLPLQAILGSVPAYNLIFISTFALNGFTTYLLARELTQSHSAAFVAGIVAAYWPYTLSNFDHPNMIAIFWIPLTLLYLRRTIKRQKNCDALLTAFCMGMIGITRWQSLVMSVPLIGGYLLFLYFTEPAGRTKRIHRLLFGIGLGSGLLMAPLATPVIVDLVTNECLEDVFKDFEDGGRTDLLAYFVSPSTYNRFWGDKVSRPELRQPYANIGANRKYVPFIGYITFALLIVGLVKQWRQTRFWLLLALAYFVAALGPQLAINGQEFPQVAMPFKLVADTITGTLVEAHRLNIFLSLPVAILVSWGVSGLLRSKHQGSGAVFQKSLVVIASVLILVEYNSLPFEITKLKTPDWYHQLAQEEGEFGIIDLPMYNLLYKNHMLYQITHGKPIAGGHVSRLPREALTLLEDTPFLHRFLQQDRVVVSDDAWVNFNINDVGRQLRMLADANIRYLVLHKQFIPEAFMVSLQDWLTISPYHMDDELIVYRTSPKPGQDFEMKHRFTNEIGFIRATAAPADAVQAGTVKVDIRWASIAEVGRDYDVCLNLEDVTENVTQVHCELLSPEWPTSLWPANEVLRGFHVMTIDRFIEPGKYLLSVTLASPESSEGIGTPAELGEVIIHPFHPSHPTQATWDEHIQLPGYDVKQTADSLEVTLYWRAVERISDSYKTFLHLIDQETGELVVQSDNIPRDWTYPTYAWEPGEIVRDVIRLPLNQTPPGEYNLWVGLYDQVTGERLQANVETKPESTDVILLITIER